MTSQNQFSHPGSSEAFFTKTYEIFWGGDRSHIQILRLPARILGTLRDTNNNPTTILRPGLMLAKITANGTLGFYDPNAVDGRQNLAGVLENELVMVDPISQTSEDKFIELVVSAPVRADALLIGGEALVGHTDEAAARADLAERFILDDII